ncbi:hypothetical protein BDN71DRAFT_730213 [Pleurotus eryngii]|uniref:RING-type domain-containing protein n=1 Tax=Pleurotus eryngii TaxID=5323 RepID=A0A9P6D881_PLEER|nr:hypothetical protein BDN71DRAFT_730213 [Pleurotus eryngii]
MRRIFKLIAQMRCLEGGLHRAPCQCSINADDGMVLDSVGASNIDPEMPSLEPLPALSPSVTPSNEASTPPVSGTSTPQRANRRPRVEDDEDADRDRRHPSQRTGGPQMQTPFGGVPFTLFGHHHNLRTGTDNNSSGNSNPQSIPGSDTTAPTDWFSLAANSPNGVAITFDLLRGGPPVVRPLDANGRPPPPLNHNHPQDHGHAHTHHDHPTTPSADQRDASGRANGGNTNATANAVPPSAPRLNLRDSFAQTQELLRQVRAMTDVLTTALGALEGAGGEDRRRGRMVIRGLEEVPEGLAQRMDALKTQGDESGMGGCAICWDSLLEDAGFGGEADPQATAPSETARTTTANQGGAAATFGGSTNQTEIPQQHAGSSTSADLPTPLATTVPEEPLPKIVVLPCSHAFHASCLVPWFSKPMRTSCPTCRFNIDPEGIIWGIGRRAREPVEGAAGPGGIGLGNLGGVAGMPFGPFALPPGFVQTMGADQAGAPHGASPAPAVGGPPLTISVNGTQVPLVLVDGSNGPSANAGAQRRSQSVPRRRTQSLPREGAPQSATTDNIDAPADNNAAANAWARGRGLPQLPPGASRTVYHAHLPIGGVDVVFDVIPVDVGRVPGLSQLSPAIALNDF